MRFTLKLEADCVQLEKLIFKDKKTVDGVAAAQSADYKIFGVDGQNF